MRANLIRGVVQFLKKDDGPTAVEYAVMLALIIVVCFAAVVSIGKKSNDSFANASLNNVLGS